MIPFKLLIRFIDSETYDLFYIHPSQVSQGICNSYNKGLIP